MAKLQPLSGATVTSAANDNVSIGEREAKKALSKLKSKNVEDLHKAAGRLGVLVASGLLKRSRAVSLLHVNIELHGFASTLYANMLATLENAAELVVCPSDVLQAPNPTSQNSINAETLMDMTFEPPRYVVPGYVVEGLTVLGGKPKLGKSWWAYNVALAVATGQRAMGSVECEQGDVLYLALEDNLRRVKDRIGALTPLRKKLGIDLSRLDIRIDAPRIDNGLFKELEDWISEKEKPRLIIIDVYMKVRPPRKNGVDPYSADYAAVVPLQEFANQNGIAILLVTHTRKMEAEDPLETVSGTNGVTGAADTVLVLSRSSKGNILYGRGRDIQEIETALKFDGGRWTILGDADEVRLSDERRKILVALRDADSPLAPKDIADATGLKAVNVRNLLPKMRRAGEVIQPEDGVYTTPITVVTPVTPEEE